MKFQTYITEQRVPKTNPLFSILKTCELDREATQELIKIANQHNLIFFSTPFDNTSIDLLVEIQVPLLKVASFDIVNHRLLEKMANTHVPVIISRGMTNQQEINCALKIFDTHQTPYALLHCISAYPTVPVDANLNVIKSLKQIYHCPIGYSDHTLGTRVPVLSVAAGACIVEKHFTLDKTLEGPDHRLSADPDDLRQMVAEIREVEQILGSGEIRLLDTEKTTLIYRRKS